MCSFDLVRHEIFQTPNSMFEVLFLRLVTYEICTPPMKRDDGVYIASSDAQICSGTVPNHSHSFLAGWKAT